MRRWLRGSSHAPLRPAVARVSATAPLRPAVRRALPGRAGRAHVHVALAPDPQLLMSDRLGDMLRARHLPLPERDLFAHHGALLDDDFLLHQRNADFLAFP